MSISLDDVTNPRSLPKCHERRPMHRWSPLEYESRHAILHHAYFGILLDLGWLRLMQTSASSDPWFPPPVVGSLPAQQVALYHGTSLASYWIGRRHFEGSHRDLPRTVCERVFDRPHAEPTTGLPVVAFPGCLQVEHVVFHGRCQNLHNIKLLQFAHRVWYAGDVKAVCVCHDKKLPVAEWR